MDLADQKAEIGNLRAELSRRRSSSYDSTQDINRLQAENDELRLYLAAIVRLLISKGIVTKGEMQQFVDVIDAEDGSVDGKYKGEVG